MKIVNLNFAEAGEMAVGAAALDVLDGHADLVWVHGFADVNNCTEIANNFYRSQDALPRLDNVPGVMIGESHYFKDPKSYYQICKKSSDAVKSMFSNSLDPVARFYSIVSTSSGGVLRPARYRTEDALHTRAIEWQERASSNYLLQPHEDVSQVFCARNTGWEISAIHTLMAVNFYARCQVGEGMLRVFDLKHSPGLAARVNVEGVGYPYPEALLADTKYVDLAVQTGDVVLLNGAFIHAVTRSRSERIVLNSFVGNLGNQELIYWT